MNTEYEYIYTKEEFNAFVEEGRTNYNNVIFSDKFEFIELDMRHYTFNNSVMNGSKFIDCQLDYASFINTKLFYSELSDCTAKCSNYNKAVMNYAKIIRCDLTQATFIDSCMTKTRYSSSKNDALNGSTLDHAVITPMHTQSVIKSDKSYNRLIQLSLLVISVITICMMKGVI
ncbi:Pentapeptide repeat-containing protein [Vibrio crassostreae]|nr:Pentapeptide repeat-containing protein [Vibrio crassostreae]